MDSMPNSVFPDLTSLGLDNLAPTGTNPQNKLYVKELQQAQAQAREQRAIEAAEKGLEAETAVAALVQAFKDNLAHKAASQPAYAYPSWRTPRPARPAPREYLNAKAVGDAVEALWLQGKEGRATEVLRRAINDAADGPQRLADQVRDEEAYLLQEAQDRALERAQSQAAGQISADEELAREMQGTRVRRAPMRLAPNNLNARATDPYDERSLEL